ncbi:MAG: DUF4270 domain-containing protein [Prevotella sp.]|nr:DUF4270 domain-containing protein [Prevotella sp.]
MKKLKYMAGALIAAMAISSCDEDTLNIGQSLTDDSDKLNVSSAEYTVTTQTIMADSVFSLASNNYFGKVRDPETGTDVTSEFTTQFNLLEYTNLAQESKVVSIFDGRAGADSCEMILYVASPFNNTDSLTAMKMRITEMSKPMEEGQRYYTDFDPASEGMLRADGIVKQKMFTYKNLAQIDSVRNNTKYQEHILVKLNDAYTAVDGTSYNNYGSYIMRQYYDHPEYFRNAYAFTHKVCPGFCFQITDGLGFHAQISNIGLRVYYTVNDSTVHRVIFTLAGTHEVLQSTHIINDRDALQSLAQETAYTYLKTPAGLFTEVTLPVDEIKQGHEADTLLASKLSFQRLNYQSFDNRLLGIPQSLLLLPKDSLHSFFEKRNVNDNVLSYIASYSSKYNTYTFNNLSNLVTALWNAKNRGMAKDANWTANHPNWNKMVLVPISYTTSSSTNEISNIQHDMSLTSIRLVGGPANANAPIRINVAYGKFR